MTRQDMDTDDADVVVPEDGRELHIGENGLWVPFRTPRATLQHFGSSPLEPYYGMIDASHFGTEEELSSMQNPELAPNEVSIKHQGEDPDIFPVETDPDVRV